MKKNYFANLWSENLIKKNILLKRTLSSCLSCCLSDELLTTITAFPMALSASRSSQSQPGKPQRTREMSISHSLSRVYREAQRA